MIIADDLLTFFVKSSVEEQDVWLRDIMLKKGGLMAIRVDNIITLREGVILTPYRSSSDTGHHSRILFEDAEHPIVREYAKHRALEITDDADFAERYAEHTVGFRHYTDATVIRLTHALYLRSKDFKGELFFDATKVVEGLTSVITCPIKPDFRRSVYAIKIVKLMTSGKVDIADGLWIRSHSDLFEYMKLEQKFTAMLDKGFTWYHPASVNKGTPNSILTYRTAGLSALGRQEVELRFKLARTDEKLAKVAAEIYAEIDALLKEEAVKFGMETLDMKRAIKRVIKSRTENIGYSEKENHDALVSSVYPRKSLSFTINLK